MDVIDHVANRNKGLKEAQPLGMGTPYDLSTKGAQQLVVQPTPILFLLLAIIASHSFMVMP